MAYRNIRDFISLLESRNEIVRVKAEVDPELEITEIADRVVKNGGPGIIFEKVKGSKMPLAINLFGTARRMLYAFERDSLDDVAGEMKKLLHQSVPVSLGEKIRKIPELANLGRCLPKLVSNAACRQNIITNPDLSLLPILKCWPGDGGKYITLPLVVTKNPETGTHNLGMYRMQVYDGRTTGMHWHIHKDGYTHFLKYKEQNKRMPVAVAIGADPMTLYASTAPLPEHVDEYLFAGMLSGRPVELIKALTSDLLIPAEAEIVLEGYVDPAETRVEGPFGDHTGFYSPAAEYPVFHLTHITHRDNPVYLATVVGKPPMEDCFLAKATERIFLPFLQTLLPEIKDINLPIEGVFHNCALVSIRKSFPGQGKKIINALWGLGQISFSKFIVVVESDTDVQNINEVAWRVFNNTDPERDIVISKGPLDALDHSSPYNLFGAKLGIDATRKSEDEGMKRPWPDEIKMIEAVKKLVDGRWKEYGLGK